MKTSKAKIIRIFGLILFWGWNILALLLGLFLLGLAILPFVFMATINGEIPLSIFLCCLILMLTPLLGIYVGVNRPKMAVPFFFGVEIPIFILTLLRIFLVRDLNLGGMFFLGSAFIAVAIYGWTLWKSHSPHASQITALEKKSPELSTITATIVGTVGVFVAILTALYALPFAVIFFKGFLSLNWVPNGSWMSIIEILMLLVSLALFFLGMIAFFVFPFYLSYFYPKSWIETRDRLLPRLSKSKFYIISAVTALVWVSLHGLTGLQKNVDYVQTLDAMSPAEKRAQMENPKAVRKKLVSAYLNEYRYLGRSKNANNLKGIYRDAFGSSSVGNPAQGLQNYLLSPLLYKGDYTDAQTAGRLYSELFDTPIQQAEQKPITKALEATYDRDQVTAGLMNIGVRNVLLKAQNISVEDHGDYAAIEIEEVYENLTFENQEIFYYFSLPEDAAITGLWIGRTADRAKMDAFIVAPRGAAQQVYEQQVRRNVDPALLEQVGPGQYRLRVFPIPVTKGRTQFNARRSTAVGADRDNYMRMHMRYVVARGEDGFALPQLLEKRNVNWSRKTTRTLNEAVISVKDGWMPSAPIGKKAAPQNTLQIALENYKIEKQSLNESNQASANRVSVKGKFAVIIDTSYSMGQQLPLLKTTLDDMKSWGASGDVSVEYFLSRADQDAMTMTPDVSAENLKPYGSLTLADMLQAFESAQTGVSYNGIIVLTDQGRYANTSSDDQDINIDAPLWILPLGLAPSAYDDNILDLIYRSGGGVSPDLKSLHDAINYGGKNRRIGDGSIWSISENNAEDFIDPNADLAALAARQIILSSSYGMAPTPEKLDIMHDLAKTYNVVTPYSSMIVLVNERQKEALKKASEADDRFDREGRSGEEVLTSPNNPMVSGVPEPHEWMLIIISLFLLLILWRKRDEWELAGVMKTSGWR